MRVDSSRKLFAGVRIDGRMREQLEKCPQRDRVFFESTDGRYLTILRTATRGGDETYIGKIIDVPASLNTMDDVRRNIWSIMQRICPGRRDEGEIKLYSLADGDADASAVAEPTLSTPARARNPRGDDDYY